MNTITIDGTEVRVITQLSNAARTLDIEFKPGEIILKVPQGQQIDIAAQELTRSAHKLPMRSAKADQLKPKQNIPSIITQQGFAVQRKVWSKTRKAK